MLQGILRAFLTTAIVALYIAICDQGGTPTKRHFCSSLNFDLAFTVYAKKTFKLLTSFSNVVDLGYEQFCYTTLSFTKIIF